MSNTSGKIVKRERVKQLTQCNTAKLTQPRPNLAEPMGRHRADEKVVNYLVFQDALVTEDFAEDVFAHVTVHGRQGVVKEIDIGICIHGTRQAHALPLTSAQVEALPRSRPKVKGRKQRCFFPPPK